MRFHIIIERVACRIKPKDRLQFDFHLAEGTTNRAVWTVEIGVFGVSVLEAWIKLIIEAALNLNRREGSAGVVSEAGSKIVLANSFETAINVQR